MQSRLYKKSHPIMARNGLGNGGGNEKALNVKLVHIHPQSIIVARLHLTVDYPPSRTKTQDRCQIRPILVTVSIVDDQ